MNYLSRHCRSISPYTAGEQPRDKSYVKLNTNECPYPPSPAVEKTLREYETGDVITYIGPDGVSTTHRVVAKEGARYVVQGDANGAPDPFRPAAEDIVGKVVLVLPGLGHAAAFLQTPFGIFLIAGAAAVLWLLIDLFSSPRRRAA